MKDSLREDLELTDVKIALPDFSVDLMKELDEKVKSLMEFSENLAPNGQADQKLKSAKFAEKRSWNRHQRPYCGEPPGRFDFIILHSTISMFHFEFVYHFHERSVPFLQCLRKGVQVKNVVEEAYLYC